MYFCTSSALITNVVGFVRVLRFFQTGSVHSNWEQLTPSHSPPCMRVEQHMFKWSFEYAPPVLKGIKSNHVNNIEIFLDRVIGS